MQLTVIFSKKNIHFWKSQWCQSQRWPYKWQSLHASTNQGKCRTNCWRTKKRSSI